MSFFNPKYAVYQDLPTSIAIEIPDVNDRMIQKDRYRLA